MNRTKIEKAHMSQLQEESDALMDRMALWMDAQPELQSVKIVAASQFAIALIRHGGLPPMLQVGALTELADLCMKYAMKAAKPITRRKPS